MNTKRGFAVIELTLILVMSGVAILLAIKLLATLPVKEEQMRTYVTALYQPKGEVRISCAGGQCTAVFTDRQEREKTVVADCGINGCVAVVTVDR